MSRKTTSPTPPDRAVVDEVGRLAAQLAPMQPVIARRDALRKQIAACYADADAEREYIAEGLEYRAVISPRRPEKKVRSMQALARRLVVLLTSMLVQVAQQALVVQ